jgi:hypothetical protein
MEGQGSFPGRGKRLFSFSTASETVSVAHTASYPMGTGVSSSIPDVTLFLILHPYYGPGVDSASNRNEYQESSWG